MTTFLVATASVHTTAAACDYLQGRIADGDSVVVVTVLDGAVDERDAGDAQNVVAVRLPSAAVETVRREGDPASAIRSVAGERDVDEIVLGRRRGEPDAESDGLGSIAGAVLAEAAVPAVVLPGASPHD